MTTPIGNLPDGPLDAAAEYYATWLPKIRHNAGVGPPELVILVFEPAGHDHRGWRLAAVQDLARELSPGRVNAIVAPGGAVPREICDYLEQARGVTGQLLSVEGG
jgi:hypothetical protein